MTQLRKFRDSISNYFDDVLNGIGKRGSSFSDIDAVSHDLDTHRWLVQEFKCEGEAIPVGQYWMLLDLVKTIPQHFTVWHVVKRNDGQIGFATYGHPLTIISVEEYQARFRQWWYPLPSTARRPAHELTDAELDAEIEALDRRRRA